MIRAIVALNADGYVIKKSLVGLPASVMDYEEMQGLVSNTLIMATMDVVHKYLPQHIAMVSRKSLLADNDKALSTMAANIENQGVGDICVLANEGILDEMDNIGLGYELVVIYPTEVGVPETLIAGKKRVDVQYCDKYMIARYEQSVTEASDVQISAYTLASLTNSDTSALDIATAKGTTVHLCRLTATSNVRPTCSPSPSSSAVLAWLRSL